MDANVFTINYELIPVGNRTEPLFTFLDFNMNIILKLTTKVKNYFSVGE